MRQGFLINVVIQGNFVNNKLPHIIIFESFTELSLDKLSGLHFASSCGLWGATQQQV